MYVLIVNINFQLKIHLGNGRSACCKLKSDNAVMFEGMKANVAKKGHKTNQ